MSDLVGRKHHRGSHSAVNTAGRQPTLPNTRRTRIRYTSMSLPYHIGNGVFGGFMPLIAASTTAATGNIYAGLAYPRVVALTTVIVGAIGIRESKEHRLVEDV